MAAIDPNLENRKASRP